MKKLSYNEARYILGGGSGLTGSLVSALKGYINTILAVGQTVGGAIRRLTTNNLCKF